MKMKWRRISSTWLEDQKEASAVETAFIHKRDVYKRQGHNSGRIFESVALHKFTDVQRNHCHRFLIYEILFALTTFLFLFSPLFIPLLIFSLP